jgi:phage repressor protein C with HTH and peptisase S24 domain/DNA-binding XRE family transcriptional regulator
LKDGYLPVSIGSLMREKRRELGISQKEMAQELRINQSGVSDIETGKRKIDLDKLGVIISKLDIYLEDWRNILQPRQDATDSLQEGKQEVSGIKSDYREVPVYNVRVSAGHGEYQGIEVIKQQLQMPKLFLPENGKIGFVKVEGDSMFPTVNHGDHVAVEFDTGYTSDGLYLIRVDDAVFVKRLQREFGQIRIISDNQMYREQVVQHDDGQQFQLIGRVALIMRVT